MSQQENRNQRQKEFRKEMAKSVLQKHGISPPQLGDEFRYEGRAKDFLIIPDEVNYAGKHMTHGEVRVWIAIFSHNRNPNPTYRVSWAGVERLALIAGVSTRQFLTYEKGLRDKELLLTRRRKDKTNLQILRDPPVEWMNETKRAIKELQEKKKAEFMARMIEDN